MKRILLAIGEPNYSKILREKFKNYADDFAVLDQEVLHHKYLLEILENEQPEILIVHDYYLQSDKEVAADKEMEWLNFIEIIRTQFDDSIRVVFLCERNKGDVFLSELVNRNVLDIFNNNSINIHQMIEQLMEKPKYSNASKFKVSTTYTNPNFYDPVDEDDVDIDENEETSDPQIDEAKKDTNPIFKKVVEKKVVNKVVEKKIVNKVVNKQVVKREFRLNVTNNVDRIVGVPIERKLVLIGSPFARSGSTFVSHLIANVLTDMGVDSTYIESPYSHAYTYDRFVGHENAPNYRSKYYKFTKEIDPKKPSVFDWKIDNLNLIVKHPSDEPVYDQKEVSFETFVKILLTSLTPVTIVDVGTDWDKEIIQEIYDMADQVYMVIEPDISNIQFLEESLDKTTTFYRKVLEEHKTSIIGNRFDEKLLKNEIITDLYKDKLNAVVPNFPPKDVFDTQYKGGFLYEQKHLKQSIDQALKPILKDLLPEQFLKKKSKEGSWLKNVFNKSIKVEPK